MIEAIDLLNEPSPSSAGASQDFFVPSSLDSPTGVMDEFAPVQPQMQQLTYKDTHNQIMSSYQTSAYQAHSSSLTVYQAPTAVTTPTLHYGAQQTHSPLYEDAVEVSYGQPPVVQGSPRTSVVPSMQPLIIRDLDEDRDDMSKMEKAMRSLVNFEDISKPIEAPQERKSREVRDAAKPNKSKPQPPRQEPYLRMDAPIGEIQSHATKTTPTKQVMRVHAAFDPAAAQHAGMMVMYGPPPQQYYTQQPQYKHQAMYAGY
jgi:hypothetical protein